ncbi:MAG: apolipoprotein N-acyltransferase [Longilinea sp.]|nr:apolipoprotein N-acyltransferase [Longilinea sp.]
MSKFSTPLRMVVGVALSILGGIAFTLAFPPYELWPLALFGYVPVLIAQYRVLPPRFSALGSAIGIAVWLQGYLGPVFAPIGTFMVWLPLAAGLLTLLTDAGLRKFHNQTGYRWFVLSGVISWAGNEMIRLFIPIAGTWAFIAYPFYQQVWLIQPVSIFGIIGMGALILLVNYVLALLLMRWLDERWQLAADAPRLTAALVRRWAWIGGASLTGWVLLSLLLLNLPLDTPTVRAAAIQPELSPVLTANAQGQDAALASLHGRMIEQTRLAAAQGAQFIVWPEGSFLWDPQVEDRLGLTALAKETQAHLAIGYLVILEGQGFRNEATILNPEGQFLGVFGKDHPVVFGGETSLTRGTYPVYHTPLGTLGTIICYDLDYTDTARKLAAQGAQLIAVPSNDWYSIGDKHFAHVIFRAVENRVAMVKADGGFDSVIVDPYGRIRALKSGTYNREATLVADVQIGNGRGTLTTHLGDWVGWLALAGLLFFSFGSGWLAKRGQNIV